MDEIRELLQNLAQLSAEDLERLRGLIIAAADDAPDDDTAENVALLNELADALEAVKGTEDAREAERQEAQQAREAARQRIAGLTGEEAEETPEETPEAETVETPEAEAETETVEQPAEPVTAAGGRVRSMAARQTPPRPSPDAPQADADARTALVASGEARGVPAGTELDRESLAVAMATTLQRMPRPQGAVGDRGSRDVILASASWADQYPDDRRATGEFEHDQRMLRRMFEPDALVATGGICSPVNVDWSINMIATADRPLQAALPSNQVSRGGLIYRPDLDFGGLTDGIGIWTEATDLAPAGATKPIHTVVCPGTSTVYVEAVTTRLGFGNMQSRFDPETVAANTNAAMAAYARTADNNLLNLIAAACTAGVTSAKVLGATRDLLTAIGQCIAAYRNLHRIPDSQRVRAIFPSWLKQLLRVDLAREIGHSQSSEWNSLAVTDQQIESLFDPYGVSPIWHLDGQPGSVAGGVAQVFSAQGASGALNSFPTKMVWYLFYEGAFQYLDGGRLDLGVVRDSLLDATNDYETFVEVFENIAYRGFTGGAIQLVSTLCANGSSAGTVDTSSSCA